MLIELVYVLKGEIELKNGYYTYRLRPGDLRGAAAWQRPQDQPDRGRSRLLHDGVLQKIFHEMVRA